MSRLEDFRRLSRAADEQSLLEDLQVVATNPWPILVVGSTMILLSLLMPHSLQRNPQQRKTLGTSVMLLSIFIAAHSADFDLSRTQMSADENTTQHPLSSFKPYDSYSTFYEEAYLDAHAIPSSRASHLILASSVVMIWILDAHLLVASLSALLAGALLTTSTLFASKDLPFLEMTIVLIVGLTVSKVLYQAMVRWLLFFFVWISLDYLDHYFLGQNSSVAMFIGQHYISWALIGQLQLAAGMIYNAIKGAP